ncbi:unnamed protein product [Rotaria sp. Silwood1]|nr:unnamed protein product [Rotaria sp. Silwood1]
MNKKKLKPSTSSSSSASTINKSQNSSTGAASKSTSENAVVPQPVRRVIQNFLLVWLDANIDASNDDFKTSIQHLQHIVASITTFTNAQECVKFLNDIKNEKIFMIVSGTLGQQIVPKVESWPQIDSIYVFCGNKSVHEQWAKKILKIKGVHTKIEHICEVLKIDRNRCDQAMISVSFNGLDPLFMYTQLLKETFLEIEDDDAKSIKDLVDYCRLHEDIPKDEIKKFQSEYRDHTPIWWYTAETFIYPMLNRGLRIMDIDIILKMGFFIRHLHNHIAELHREQQSNKLAMPSKFQVFRGQGLSLEDFEKMKKTNGGLMSFNNFLSTSRNRDISLKMFARPAAFNSNSVGILFVMSIDTAICTLSSTPFVNVIDVGFFKDKEEEILFSTHTIFRIDRIERIQDDHTDRLWQVNLILVGNQDKDFDKLTVHMREELHEVGTGWSRLGQILIRVGDFEKAGYLYQLLLEKASCDEDRAQYNIQLGTVYAQMGEYSKAITLYQRSLELKKVALPPNHPDLATSYNNIGAVYDTVEARMIRTQTGDLAGLTSNGVDIYLSIRYGQVVRCWSPASLSRFWIGVGNATVFGPVCHPYGPHGQPEIGEENEDCLFLNIWVP